jgi:hypothetical protein
MTLPKKESKSMNRQASSPPSEPTRQDKRREIGRTILLIVLFVLMLVGTHYYAAANLQTIVGVCWGQPNGPWCNGPFLGLLSIALIFPIAGVTLMFRRRYRMAMSVMVIQGIATFIFATAYGIPARW